MESKKTKLTISGGPKKSFKDIDSLNNQGKKTVIINKQPSKSLGKSKTFKGSGYKSPSTSFKKGANYKSNLKISNSNLKQNRKSFKRFYFRNNLKYLL